MHARIAVFIGVTTALSGCDNADDRAPPTFAVADSQGIAIVESFEPAWNENDVWQISPEPELVIGSMDGSPETTFGNVRAVGWLHDGRIFVGDEQAHSIRVFSGSGDYLETVGREGEGPGELQWFLTVAPYRADSLWVYDYAQLAVSVFSPELTFARRFANPVPRNNYWIVSALADGRFLLRSPGQVRSELGPGIVPDSSFIIVSAADGSSVDTVGAFEATLKRVGPNGRGQPLHLQPFGLVGATGAGLLWYEAKRFEYALADADGTVRRIVRKRHEIEPVTDAVIEAFKDHYMELLGPNPEGGPERIRRSLEEAEYLRELPAMSHEFRVDPLGYIWVGRYHFVGASVETWEVFDSEGVWQGSVQTPAGLEVHEIGTDRVIGVVKDDFDVPYVHVFRLDRRTRGAS